MDEEVEKEEEEGEGVDPTLLGDLHHTVSINLEQNFVCNNCATRSPFLDALASLALLSSCQYYLK